jgi:hypothetical protein
MAALTNRSPTATLLAGALLIAIAALVALWLQLSMEPILTAGWRRGG